MRKRFGQHAKVVPHRGPAIPAAGVVDGDPNIDDIDLDINVPDGGRVAAEDETLGIPRGDGTVFAKEENGGHTPRNPQHLFDSVDLTDDAGDNDGFLGRSFPITVREQRVARARRVFGPRAQLQERGDQVDQAAAEDHTITDVSKALQSVRPPDDSVGRKALQRLHVKWYHCATGLKSLFGAAGVFPRGCNLVPHVVQACQVCRPWGKPGQSNKFTYPFVLQFNEEVQFDLMVYRSTLEPGLGGAHGIPIVQIDCCIRW